MQPAKRIRRLPTDEEVLAAVVAEADDGFCSFRELALRLRGSGERELRRAVGRSTRRGLLIERRRQGSGYYALTAEGWRLHRGAVG